MNARSAVSRSSSPQAPASKASAASHSARGPRATVTFQRRKLCFAIALLLAGIPASGCYYAHLASGQLRLLRARQSIEAVLADPTTPDALRESLVLVDDARALAARLGLEVGERYRSYAPWPGDRVVTIVVATRPGEVEPAGFWFPVVGRVPYKGFFDPTRAEAEAQRLAEAGEDTCVVPVPAYSTLGWFDDPVTEPMLRAGPGRLVETLIHELVHATIFASSQPEFNEGVASFVGQEASVRFFAERDGPGSERAREARRRVDDDRAIAAIRLALRERVSELYHDEPPGEMRRQARARLEARSREALAALPLTTRDASTLSREARLNDACLSLSGTYAADLGRYALRLEALGGDLVGLVEAARAASGAPDPRAALLGPP